MSYTKLEIIKTRDNSFKHIPNGNEAMAFYISKGHYTMENGFLTLTEKGKPSRPKVAWTHVTFRDTLNGVVETFASFDDLDDKLVNVNYPLARQLSTNESSALQINADWDAVSGSSQILNKPDLPPFYFDEVRENLGIGETTLTPAATGDYNLAYGNGALTANTVGKGNVAIGNYALYSNTVGNSNVAIGIGAIQNQTGYNETSGFNVAIGGYSQYDATGKKNTSVGYYSFFKATGTFNTALGFQAGRALTSGDRNILIEMPYNDGVTTGSRNIIIDGVNQAGIVTGSGNTVIGGYNGSVPDASDQIYIGTGSGISRLEVSSTGIYKLVAGAPIYEDNAAAIAGGLSVGQLYRTAIGQLMIVFK
jgi:hypothetical protein